MIPYEQAAKSGAPCPDNVTGMDRCLYKCIRWLVKRYRNGEIDADESRVEMKAIRDTYDQLQDLYRQWAAHQEFSKNIHTAVICYAKAPSRKTADALYKTVTRLVRMDDAQREALLEYARCSDGQENGSKFEEEQI